MSKHSSNNNNTFTVVGPKPESNLIEFPIVEKTSKTLVNKQSIEVHTIHVDTMARKHTIILRRDMMELMEQIGDRLNAIEQTEKVQEKQVIIQVIDKKLIAINVIMLVLNLIILFGK